MIQQLVLLTISLYIKQLVIKIHWPLLCETIHGNKSILIYPNEVQAITKGVQF